MKTVPRYFMTPEGAKAVNEAVKKQLAALRQARAARQPVPIAWADGKYNPEVGAPKA
jgi:hypothetical protein